MPEPSRTRPRCVVLDDYQGVATDMADWSRLTGDLGVDLQVRTDHLTDEDDVVAALDGAAIVVAMRERTPLPRAVLERLPHLRLLVTTGMRNAAIDLVAARDLGITVCGTASQSAPAAEITWALILGLARQVAPEHASVRAGGPWQHTLGTDLAGATLGLLGLGKIGASVARVGLAFDMDVVAWSPHLTDERAAEVGVRRAASKEEVLRSADFVSLHLILGGTTRGLVGRDDLALMKRSAYFVNTSRAGLVDTDALADALREGRIAGAGLDVFDVEPLPAYDPFRSLPGLLTTPHLGYVTHANYRTYFGEAVEDIEAFLTGDPVRVITP